MSSIAIEGFRPALQQNAHWSHADRRADPLFLTFTLPEGTDLARLQASLAQVLEQQEILRTRLLASPGMQQPVQVIAEQLQIDWREVADDLTPPALHRLLSEALVEASLAVAVIRGAALRACLAVPAANAVPCVRICTTWLACSPASTSIARSLMQKMKPAVTAA